MIIEILNAIWVGFWGFISGTISTVPAIVELKNTIEKFTPAGMITECMVHLGIPAILITIVVFIIKKVKA